MLERYLDHNATSPLLPAARTALLEGLERAWANPDSQHSAGREAAMALDRARRRLADWMGCPPAQLCFTSGATESNGLALSGLRSEERPLVVGSAVEHPSALSWLDRRLPVDSEGRVQIDALEQLLREEGGRVALVSVQAANNETGVLQPIPLLRQLCQDHGVPLHCDATQMPGRLPLPEADLLSLSAHKAGGPRGVGLLQSRLPLRPLLRGGPQERGRRPGTPAVALISAMAACVEHWGPMPAEGRQDVDALVLGLGGEVLGLGAERLPNTTCALFDQPGDLVVIGLDLEGWQVSTGSACASGAARPSHVLQAMGRRGVPVRFSLGLQSRVEGLAGSLSRVLGRLRQT